jgi:hypothetical protein
MLSSTPALVKNVISGAEATERAAFEHVGAHGAVRDTLVADAAAGRDHELRARDGVTDECGIDAASEIALRERQLVRDYCVGDQQAAVEVRRMRFSRSTSTA